MSAISAAGEAARSALRSGVLAQRAFEAGRSAYFRAVDQRSLIAVRDEEVARTNQSHSHATGERSPRKEDIVPEQEHGPSIKDPEQYEALRDEGMSKEKPARISNESAGSSRSEVGARGATAENYEDPTVGELQERAREIGIQRYSDMDKGQLIDALRNH